MSYEHENFRSDANLACFPAHGAINFRVDLLDENRHTIYTERAVRANSFMDEQFEAWRGKYNGKKHAETH